MIVLDEGRIVAEGTNAELWHSSQLYRELLTGPELELPDALVRADRRRRPTDAWPQSGDRADRGSPRVELATMFAGMAAGGGLHNLAGRAGLVAATPELLARVDALPPLRGEPDVDLAEATTPDGTSTLAPAGEALPLAAVLRRSLRAGRCRHDPGRPAADPPRPRRRRRGRTTARVLVAMCIAFLAVQLLSWGNQIVELLHTSHTAERMLYSLRARTFAHLQRLSLDYYDKEMGGRIMTRMTTDVEALAQLLQQGLLLALTSFVSCFGVVGILLVLDVRLALAAFIVLPVLVRRDRLVPARLATLVPPVQRRDLDGQRRAAREPVGRPRHAVARSRRQQRAAVRRPLGALPRRSTEVDAADVDLLRQQPAAQHDRQGDHPLVRRPPHRPGHPDAPAC